ncbi:hypothetical protein [Glaciimonas sp. PAMC28666]|uniref:hypothetical protein n=1 Tax=Glaciimonas sp. PAMC28666 TaxID=2807626 RepID=UPI001965FB86|nr:hypothetical protein [Glaciimonas sp. PAMC28666]QRX81621.1 hypothetical protein JQN73_15885 [Glaciimonas sp. PAMC28666]
MFDGFLSGMFGGLFGPAIAQYLSRFKYWIVFLTTTLTVHGGTFILDWLNTNFLDALKRSVCFVFTTVGFFAPMGIGLLAVFVAFVGSLNTAKKSNEDDKNSW